MIFTRKISLALILFFLGTHACFAQDQDTHLLLKDKQFKANFNLVGVDLSYETRLDKSLTAYFEGGLSFGFLYRNGIFSQGEQISYGLAPFLAGSIRWYYNLEKRYKANRNIQNNAANFVSVKVGYRFAPIAQKDMYVNPAAAIAPYWGIQRNLDNHFSFEVLAGYSFIYEVKEKYWDGNVSIKFKIGYIIF